MNQIVRQLVRYLPMLMRGPLRKIGGRWTPLLIAGITAAGFGLTRSGGLLEGSGGTSAPAPTEVGQRFDCKVLSVQDGDTMSVNCAGQKRKIRVWGIDAPEMKQKPWGEQARKVMASLANNQQVQIEVEAVDQYDRSVSRVYRSGNDLGLELVSQGKAIVYAQFNDRSDYKNAQQSAKSAGLGVWSEPGAQQNPSSWRKLNPR